jgi:site-specific recombinase XerD
MIETRSGSTALNKHKGLQQFFRWLLVDEQAIVRSPIDRVRQPKTPTKLVPVMREADTTKVLAAGRLSVAPIARGRWAVPSRAGTCAPDGTDM